MSDVRENDGYGYLGDGVSGRTGDPDDMGTRTQVPGGNPRAVRSGGSMVAAGEQVPGGNRVPMSVPTRPVSPPEPLRERIEAILANIEQNRPAGAYPHLGRRRDRLLLARNLIDAGLTLDAARAQDETGLREAAQEVVTAVVQGAETSPYLWGLVMRLRAALSPTPTPEAAIDDQ